MSIHLVRRLSQTTSSGSRHCSMFSLTVATWGIIHRMIEKALDLLFSFVLTLNDLAVNKKATKAHLGLSHQPALHCRGNGCKSWRNLSTTTFIWMKLQPYIVISKRERAQFCGSLAPLFQEEGGFDENPKWDCTWTDVIVVLTVENHIENLSHFNAQARPRYVCFCNHEPFLLFLIYWLH